MYFIAQATRKLWVVTYWIQYMRYSILPPKGLHWCNISQAQVFGSSDATSIYSTKSTTKFDNIIFISWIEAPIIVNLYFR